MAYYKIEWKAKAEKSFDKLSSSIKLQINKYLKKVASLENPRAFGKALEKNLTGFWSYRVGKYRIIVDIQDDKLIVYIVAVGKRETIYEDVDKSLK